MLNFYCTRFLCVKTSKLINEVITTYIMLLCHHRMELSLGLVFVNRFGAVNV